MIAAGLRTLPIRTVAAIEDLVLEVWAGQFGQLVEGHDAVYRQRLRPLAEALAAALR